MDLCADGAAIVAAMARAGVAWGPRLCDGSIRGEKLPFMGHDPTVISRVRIVVGTATFLVVMTDFHELSIHSANTFGTLFLFLTKLAFFDAW